MQINANVKVKLDIQVNNQVPYLKMLGQEFFDGYEDASDFLKSKGFELADVIHSHKKFPNMPIEVWINDSGDKKLTAYMFNQKLGTTVLYNRNRFQIDWGYDFDEA